MNMGSFNINFKKYIFILFFSLSFFSVYSDDDIKESYDSEFLKVDDGLIPLVPLDRVPDSALVRRDIAKSWLLAAPEEIASRHLLETFLK